MSLSEQSEGKRLYIYDCIARLIFLAAVTHKNNFKHCSFLSTISFFRLHKVFDINKTLWSK